MDQPTPAFEVSARYRASRSRLLRLLDDVSTSGEWRHTVYLRPGSPATADTPPSGDLDAVARAFVDATVAGAVRRVGASETGLALFLGDRRVIAVAPPFHVGQESVRPQADTAPLMAILDRPLVVGVLLLRLGRYAVGLLDGDRLAASKVGTRYVKNRHRAGGSSQRRFERSRERLVRELFDKTCRVATEVFAPFDGRIDHLLLGGERHTLEAFRKRCDLMRRYAPLTLRRRLDVDRPGQVALEGIHREVWMSRVTELARVAEADEANTG